MLTMIKGWNVIFLTALVLNITKYSWIKFRRLCWHVLFYFATRFSILLPNFYFATAFLFCRDIFFSPWPFYFTVAFLICCGFFSFAVAFLVCHDFSVLRWLFYFALNFSFCCGCFVLPSFLLCHGLKAIFSFFTKEVHMVCLTGLQN